MKQVSLSELKRMKVEEIEAIMPCQITADGEIIGELKKPYIKPPNPLTFTGV